MDTNTRFRDVDGNLVVVQSTTNPLPVTVESSSTSPSKSFDLMGVEEAIVEANKWEQALDPGDYNFILIKNVSDTPMRFDFGIKDLSPATDGFELPAGQFIGWDVCVPSNGIKIICQQAGKKYQVMTA